MKWLITGAGGQLGRDLTAALSSRDDHDVRAVDRHDLDVSDVRAVSDLVALLGPDVVLNAAAYTAVDAAETDEEAAYRGNATGPAALAAAVATSGGRLVHVSTDYVFAGDATEPYEVDDEPAPKSAYGRTKLAGEQAVRELLPDCGYVVRTSWVYGVSGNNFVKTMARLQGERETVAVVDDQRGSPTWSADLARALVELGSVGPPAGTYHCTGAGQTTWYGLARAVFEELGADPERVHPATTAQFPRPAPRPAYSVLSDRSWKEAGLTPMPDWRDALHNAMAAGIARQAVS